MSSLRNPRWWSPRIESTMLSTNEEAGIIVLYALTFVGSKLPANNKSIVGGRREC